MSSPAEKKYDPCLDQPLGKFLDELQAPRLSEEERMSRFNQQMAQAEDRATRDAGMRARIVRAMVDINEEKWRARNCNEAPQPDPEIVQVPSQEVIVPGFGILVFRDGGLYRRAIGLKKKKILIPVETSGRASATLLGRIIELLKKGVLILDDISFIFDDGSLGVTITNLPDKTLISFWGGYVDGWLNRFNATSATA